MQTSEAEVGQFNDLMQKKIQDTKGSQDSQAGEGHNQKAVLTGKQIRQGAGEVTKSPDDQGPRSKQAVQKKKKTAKESGKEQTNI